jgi:hypothetical protein
MDYRFEPRFATDQPVVVTNLGVQGSSFPGKITNFSAHGIRLILSEELPIGAVIKVEWATTLLLGQIMYCESEGEVYSAGMELEEAVYDTRIFIPNGEAQVEDQLSQKDSRLQ